jgi:hypothetical protein
VTLLWNEVEFVQERLPAPIADLDAVLPAITVSVAMLVVISLLTPPSDDASTTEEQQRGE